MSQPLFPGNQTQLLNWYRNERLEALPKWQAWHAIAYAEIDTTLRSQIDLLVPSHTRDSADIPLVIPAGARVYYIGLRTPADVPLVGTTGERLKVATAHTDANPNIQVASSAIAANSIASAVATPFDAALATLGASTQYRLLVSNTGNTAAGNGVRVATGKKRVIADICYLTAGEPSRLEQLGYPSTY